MLGVWSTRTNRKRQTLLGERTGRRIIGTVCRDDRPEEAHDRPVPGAWDRDVVIGKDGIPANALADVLIHRPCHVLGYYTPKEIFTKLLNENTTVA